MTVPSNKVFLQGALTPVSADQLNSMIQVVANVAALRAFTGTNNQVIWMEGTTTANDGGQSLYIFNSTSTAADTGNTVIAPTGSTTGRWLITTPFFSQSALGFGVVVVASNQAPNPTQGQTAYVATQDLSITLPVTTSVTNKYNLAFRALGGDITIIPQAGEVIDNMLVGQSLPLPLGSSVMLGTDANGKWYTFFTTERIVLSQQLNLYVSPTGSDVTNTGLSPSSPFRTMQHAWGVLNSDYDLAGNTAIVNLAHGTYTDGVNCQGFLLGQAGPVFFQGDLGNPAAVIVDTSATYPFLIELGAYVQTQGMTLTTTLSQGALFNVYRAQGNVGPSMIFGSSTLYQILAQQQSIVTIVNNYTVTGGGYANVVSSLASLIAFGDGVNPIVCTLSGTPAFSGAFAIAQLAATVWAINFSFTGSATGTRYVASTNGVIDTNGGGANYFPGSSPGSTGSGGQYV